MPKIVKGKEFFKNALAFMREGFSIFAQISAAEVEKGEIRVMLKRPADADRLKIELGSAIQVLENLDVNLIDPNEKNLIMPDFGAKKGAPDA